MYYIKLNSQFSIKKRCIHYEYIYLLLRFPMPINCRILKKIFKKSKYNCNAMKIAILSCATTEPSDWINKRFILCTSQTVMPVKINRVMIESKRTSILTLNNIIKHCVIINTKSPIIHNEPKLVKSFLDVVPITAKLIK